MYGYDSVIYLLFDWHFVNYQFNLARNRCHILSECLCYIFWWISVIKYMPRENEESKKAITSLQAVINHAKWWSQNNNVGAFMRALSEGREQWLVWQIGSNRQKESRNNKSTVIITQWKSNRIFRSIDISGRGDFGFHLIETKPVLDSDGQSFVKLSRSNRWFYVMNSVMIFRFAVFRIISACFA